MEKSLQQPNTHVLMFRDGSKKFLNQRAYDVIYREMISMNARNFTLNGTVYNKADIIKLISMSDYYEEYPAERPPQTNLFDPPPVTQYDIINRAPTRGLEQIIVGLKKYINSAKYQGTDAPKELLAIAQRRLDAHKQKEEDAKEAKVERKVEEELR